MKRAERRHEEIKRKLKVRKAIEADLQHLEAIGVKIKDPLHRTVERQTGKRVATPCTCSNPFCCGNPRRTIGRKIIKISEVKRIREPLDNE